MMTGWYRTPSLGFDIALFDHLAPQDNFAPQQGVQFGRRGRYRQQAQSQETLAHLGSQIAAGSPQTTLLVGVRNGEFDN